MFLFCVMWVMPFCVMCFFCVMWVMPATNLENSIGWEDKVRAAQRAAHGKSSVAWPQGQAKGDLQSQWFWCQTRLDAFIGSVMSAVHEDLQSTYEI